LNTGPPPQQGQLVPPPVARRHRVLTASQLARLKEDPDRWVVPQMIPKGGRVLLYGVGSSYKTSLALDLFIAVASGGNMLRQFPVKAHGPVLICSAESNIHENSRRLKQHCRAHGIDLSTLPLHYCQEPFYLDQPADASELASWIEEIRPIIVMIDPLDSFFMGDENSAKETKPVRRTIDALIETYNCTFVILHHTTKGKSDKLPRGSSAWFDWADAALFMEKKMVKLGLPERQVFLEMTAKKQRNGQVGRVLSGIPVHDPILDIFTFDIYDGKNKEQAVKAYWSRKAYTVLMAAPTPMTASMLADVLQVRPDALKEPMELLQSEKLAVKDCFVERPWGPGGSRVRKVPAWRAMRRYSQADLRDILLRAEQNDLEQSEQGWDLCPLLPDDEASNVVELRP